MKIAIFDFDGTLFMYQTVPYLMKYYVANAFSKSAYCRYLCIMGTKILKYKLPFFKDYNKEQFRKEANLLFIQAFNGKKEEELNEFFEGAVPYIMNYLNPEIVDEVKRCKQEGYECILLSGCYTPLLKGVGDELDIDRIIGSDIHHQKVGKIEYIFNH